MAPYTRRQLSQPEFQAITQKILATAPANLTKEQFEQWKASSLVRSELDRMIMEAEVSPTPVEGSALSRFGSNFGQTMNPITALEGIGSAVAHPITTGQHILGAQWEQAKQIPDLIREGRIPEAQARALAAVLPIIGPAAAGAGEQIAEGDIAGGLGKAAGLIIPTALPSLARGSVQAARAITTPAARAGLADTLEAGATQRMVDVMASPVGRKKTMFGAMAADVGPDVARQTTAKTTGGLFREVSTKSDASFSALDAAYDTIPGTSMIPTTPVIAGIDQAIAKLQVSGIKGTVDPATRAARLNALRTARSEVKALGSVANVKNLRKLRIAWDEGAKEVFTPTVVDNYLSKRAAGSGWADARTALNDVIVTRHPSLAPLNADAHLWSKAQEVMQAAEEAERVRPTVGRQIMAHGLGAATGAAMGGGVGAMAGAMLAPTVEKLLANIRPTMKLTAARQMTRLADALRAGNVPAAQSAFATLNALVAPSAGQVGRMATSPSGAQETPAGAMPALP